MKKLFALSSSIWLSQLILPNNVFYWDNSHYLLFPNEYIFAGIYSLFRAMAGIFLGGGSLVSIKRQNKDLHFLWSLPKRPIPVQFFHTFFIFVFQYYSFQTP
jgi:hypothetical protein